MGSQIRHIVDALCWEIERSEVELFNFMRSCDVQKSECGYEFVCSTKINGAQVEILTHNMSVQGSDGVNRVVKRINVDPGILVEACNHALRASEAEKGQN
ncbi:MAG: hypothetical protein AAGA97_01185 [Pseudomonadota bacterium]